MNPVNPTPTSDLRCGGSSPPPRRRRVGAAACRLAVVCGVGACFALPGPPVAAQASRPLASTGERADRPIAAFDPSTASAIERGLQFLARRQNVDGSWNDRVGRKVHMTYRGTDAPHVGVTGLAGIAFLSHGAFPGEGSSGFVVRDGETFSYCEVIEKALAFVIAQVSPDNGFISAHGSRMYSHAFATLFLAEAYGVGVYRDSDRLRRALKSAIGLIVSAQTEAGGWRYRPGAPDEDMSITVCQVMALRAARNAGVEVPRETIQRAVDYVKRSYLDGVGAFTYQLGIEFRGVGSRWTPALTAAGVTTLYGAGEYDAYQIQEGLRYIWKERPGRFEAAGHFDYYYFQYYAVQAAFQRGGDYWRNWYDYIRRDLLAIQEADGCWTDLVGSNYATAMATIILQFPNQYLPITEN